MVRRGKDGNEGGNRERMDKGGKERDTLLILTYFSATNSTTHFLIPPPPPLPCLIPLTYSTQQNLILLFYCMYHSPFIHSFIHSTSYYHIPLSHSTSHFLTPPFIHSFIHSTSHYSLPKHHKIGLIVC